MNWIDLAIAVVICITIYKCIETLAHKFSYCRMWEAFYLSNKATPIHIVDDWDIEQHVKSIINPEDTND